MNHGRFLDRAFILFVAARWSNNAFYACTRIFASCLQDAMAQRFYNLVLLPRVVEDLKFNKRLNYHLYQARPHPPCSQSPATATHTRG